MKLPGTIDGDELARLLNRYGYGIDHQTGSHQRLSAVISEKHMTLPFPATNLFAWEHCMKFLRMLQNIRRSAGNRLSWNCLDNPSEKYFFMIAPF